MDNLTPEREAKIRAFLDGRFAALSAENARELLNELDRIRDVMAALTGENSALRELQKSTALKLAEAEAEADRLRPYEALVTLDPSKRFPEDLPR
jgi:uncharacterized membrane protein